MNERRVVLVVTGEQLFDTVVVGLSTLARHAVDHCGADGEAVISASLLSIGQAEATVAASVRVPNRMNQGLGQMPGSHELQVASPSEHTLPLHALHTPSADMMVAARLLISDLLSLFGLAGFDLITDRGSVVPAGFKSALTPTLISDWARRWKIPTA